MDAPGVVPLRAGFDVVFRGYSRKQVLEHIDLLEDQLRMIAIDRDEATKLNTNCRKVCEELRTELDEARARLARIESSSSTLPHAMQGMQNMLSMAEDEADTIRQRAERYAETVRGTADTDARQIRAEAETAAAGIRADCEQVVVELESRRDRINAEHSTKIDALHSRAHDLRVTIQREYEQALGRAQAEAEDLLSAARQRCAEAEQETERRRVEMERDIEQRRATALRELGENRGELDEWRKQLIVMLCNSRSAIDASVATVTGHGAALQEQADRWFRAAPQGRSAAAAEPTGATPAKSTVESPPSAPDADIPRQQNGAQHPDGATGTPAKSGDAALRTGRRRSAGRNQQRRTGTGRSRTGTAPADGAGADTTPGEPAPPSGNGATGREPGDGAAPDSGARPAAGRSLRSTSPIARD